MGIFQQEIQAIKSAVAQKGNWEDINLVAACVGIPRTKITRNISLLRNRYKDKSLRYDSNKNRVCTTRKNPPKPGGIQPPKIPTGDPLGGDSLEDHYRRAMMKDAMLCNKRMGMGWLV